MGSSAVESAAILQDTNAMLRTHLQQLNHLFDQVESADITSGARSAQRREKLMSDMDHE